MSRIGKKIINIPNGVAVDLQGKKLSVKGPKGDLSMDINEAVTVVIEGSQVTLKVENETDKKIRSLWGLHGSVIKNMMKGVTEGYKKELEVNGVGYKVALQGRKLVLNVGFSHPVNFELPQGVEAKVDANVITISGTDKYIVGETAARIRKIKKPEPYQGKGIKYVTETIRRKAGKTAAKA